MKSIHLKISFVLLVLCFMGAGCEKDERDPLCYQGKVVNINQGGRCYNMIEIIETIKGGEIAVGNTISFDPKLYGATLKVGDVVYFKIIHYEVWVGPATTECQWPRFIAQIEFCKN